MDSTLSYSSGNIESSITLSSSSRTGSGRSGQSTERRDDDLTKDNTASPLDLECKIQAERITKILDEAVYKTTLAICLPDLVAEYKTLSTALSWEHMDDLLFIFEEYEKPKKMASLLNEEAMEEIKGITWKMILQGDLSLKNRLNPELGHLLYIMNSYPAIRPKVTEMIQKMRNGYNSEEVPNPSVEYLIALEKFRDLMVKQMNITAAEELDAKLNTRKLENSNNKLKGKIAELTFLLKTEQENFQHTMNIKTQIINKLENDLQLLHSEANTKLKKKILDSERQMVLAARAHVVKHDMLKEEDAEYRQAYDAVLTHHMQEEKNQRARRFKVETQLLSWIQKYDVEMTEKQVELDDLTERYEEEIRKTEECEAKLAEQDKEYVPLMAEREEEYHQEMMAKMMKFQMEHAARVIQHAWREVLAHRAEAKKLKRALMKIKQAQAAAERAAALEEKKNKKKKKKA